MKRVRTHYDNLKVARDAPQEVIRAAYKSLAQTYHPDRNPGNERASRIMKLVNTSYEVLSDPEQRERHDRWIAEQEASDRPEEQSTNEAAADTLGGSPAGQRSYFETGRVARKTHYERNWFIYLAVVVVLGGWWLARSHRQEDFEIVRSPPQAPITSERSSKKDEQRSQKRKLAPQPSVGSGPSEERQPKSMEPPPSERDTPTPLAPVENTPDLYARRLSTELGRDQHYPRRAQAMGWQGTAEVLVRIGEDAKVKNVSIAKSTGYDILDEAALEKVRSAKSLPPPPAGFEGREFSILVPIVFSLQ